MHHVSLDLFKANVNNEGLASSCTAMITAFTTNGKSPSRGIQLGQSIFGLTELPTDFGANSKKKIIFQNFIFNFTPM